MTMLLLHLQPQYEFIHEAINEAIMCGDTSIKAPELKDWLAKLTPDPETGKTVLDDQFKVRNCTIQNFEG